MGIIIAPFLLVSILVFISSILNLKKSINNKEVNQRTVFLGTFFSITIYLFLFFDYRFSEEAYALGTYFMFPFYMILLPYGIGTVLKPFNYNIINTISNSLLISVILSGLFIITFNDLTFGIIDFLGISKYH